MSFVFATLNYNYHNQSQRFTDNKNRVFDTVKTLSYLKGDSPFPLVGFSLLALLFSIVLCWLIFFLCLALLAVVRLKAVFSLSEALFLFS